jgi:cytochrome c-type biogenesis protein CcmH
LITAYVIWPLLRRADPGAGGGTDAGAPAHAARPADSGAGEDAMQLNREIVRERRAQLDRELALLPAGSPERDRLILEFSGAALADLEPQAGSRWRGTRQHWITAAVLAGLLAAAPLAFYRLVGTPDAVRADFAQPAQPQDLGSLVAELERRLQAEPQAADGWLLLGRSKSSLGDLDGAIAAMERALALDSTVPELAAQIRVDLADTLAQAAGAKLSGRPWSLILEALQHDARNQKALALAGAYQVTQGDRAAALSYWEPLLSQLPAGSQQQAQIASFIDDLKAGRNPGTGAAIASPAAPAAPPSQAAAGPVLRGRIELDPSLAGSARPQDTLFVAVRGVDQDDRPAGPPAAVLRARVAELPLDFELSDRQAMSAAAKLSDQGRVIVVARVSRAGTAAGSAGDLEGRSPVVAPDAQAVRVRIDRVLP